MSFFLIGNLHANKSLKEIILKLDTKDFKDKILVIEEIAKNDNDLNLLALKSILEGKLYIRKSDKSILLVDIKDRKYFAFDFFDNTELGVLSKRKLKKIKINNNLRNILSNKIAVIQITRGNKEEKINAILEIIKDGNFETLKVINKVLLTENDNDVIKYFNLAKNTIIARYGKDSERIEAIKSLAGNTNNDIVNILKDISENKSQPEVFTLEAQEAYYKSIQNIKFNNIIKTIFLDYL